MVKYHLVHEIPRIIVKTRPHPDGNYIKTKDIVYVCEDCGEETNTFKFHKRGESVMAICPGEVLGGDEDPSYFFWELLMDYSALGKKYVKKSFRHSVNKIILLEDF